MKTVSSVFGHGRLRAAFFMPALCIAALAAFLSIYPPSPGSAQFVDQSTFGSTSTGSANAQVISIANLRGHTAGVVLRFIPGFANTGPATLNDGFGAVAIVRPSSIGNVALSGQELLTGELTCVTYNGTAYQLSCNVDLTPIGRTVDFRGSATPRGTLIEDGSCVSRTTYAALFSVIASTYSACDGSTTFGVPDSRGTAFMALDGQGANGLAGRITTASCATPNAVGLCGNEQATLTAAKIPTIDTSIGGIGVTVTSTTSQVVQGVADPVNIQGGATPVGVLASGTGSQSAITSTGSINAGATAISSNTGGTSVSHPVLNPSSFGRRAIKY